MVSRRLAFVTLLSLACSSSYGEPPPPRPPEVAVRPATPPQSERARQLESPRDPRETMLAKAVVSLLTHEHLRKLAIDDVLSRHAFDFYLDRLDPSKMFLLQSDVAALGKYADKIDDELRDGNLELAHEGTRAYVARVGVVEKMVAETLAKPVDLSNQEFIELDPKKVERATTDDELRDRWRRRLELEVMERVSSMEQRLAGPPPKPKGKPAGAGDIPDDEDDGAEPLGPTDKIPPTPEGREIKARTDLALAYAGRFARLRTPAPLAAATGLINAVTAAYDPHTDYLPPADKANFDIAMSGSLEGIGAVLRERDHYVEVAELVPGGASWRQGRLSQGDLILSVANEGHAAVDVADMRIDDVVKMIRGKKGTVVKLRVRKASNEEETISITRDVIVIEESYAKGAIIKKKGGPAYGYVYLPSFYGGQGSGQRTAPGDVRRLLQKLTAQKVAGVILDLRGNGGGYLTGAVDLAGLLIDKGPVVQVQDSGARRETLSDTDGGESFDGPMIVLVDRFSASASEIVAGALQDYHRAVVVGTGPSTHGKGTVQSLASLDRLTGGQVELGVLKLTIQQFFRVSGASTQLEGVVPDVQLPDPYGHVESGEKKLENAIPWSAIDQAPHRDWGGSWKTAELAARSAVRVAKDPQLTKVVARTKLLSTWRDDTKIPLQKTEWEARRKAHKAALEQTAPDLAKAPARLEVTQLEEEAKPAPGPGGKPDDRPARWRETVAHDPWLDECVAVLGDMVRGK